MSIFDRITVPSDLHGVTISEMETLAAELREQIIETVNRNGGHLASPLGVVEITIALHYVYNIGVDKLVWDVGHQSYAHKLLTGRKDRFPTLRTKGGLSGYPKIQESPYDSFGTGHSSTSISAAVGMAIARDRLGLDHHVIAVIGDGAMTGGMALEALSHAGHLGLNMLVVLNDNEMSISPNTGALAHYFNRLIMARPYKRAKEDVGTFVKRLIGGRITRTIHDLEKSVKGFITKGTLFQELGFNYIGPVDGHDLPLLIECLKSIKALQGPVLFHCHTEKGKGLKVAEQDPQKYHGIKPNSLRKDDQEGVALPGKVEKIPGSQKTFTEVFGETLVDLARENPRIIGITAAMPAGTGLSALEKAFPERFFDVGICEQHAVTLAAGMAASGMRPVAAIYSTFLQRGYDQVIHDVCLQNLPVLFAIDRAGLVGEDSPTHEGAFDISFLRAIPNLQILVPRDDVDLRAMLHGATHHDGPVAIRYPRDMAVRIGDECPRGNCTEPEMLRAGEDVLFLALGPVGGACLQAAGLLEKQGYSAGVADMRCAKPLDGAFLDRLPDIPIITVEENALAGGFGSAVLEHYADTHGVDRTRVLRVGFPDHYWSHATRQEQLIDLGLDAPGLARRAQSFLEMGVTNAVK